MFVCQFVNEQCCDVESTPHSRFSSWQLDGAANYESLILNFWFLKTSRSLGLRRTNGTPNVKRGRSEMCKMKNRSKRIYPENQPEHIGCCQKSACRLALSCSCGNHLSLNELCQLPKIKINPQKSHNKNAWVSTLTSIQSYICIFTWYFPTFCASVALSICYGWLFYVRALYSPYSCVSVCVATTHKNASDIFFLVSLSYRHAFQFSTVRMIEDTRSCESITAPS